VEGRGGGEFYTPRSVVKLLVEMLEPLEGRIFDPACGSGGMFVQSARFVEAHHGNPGAISVFGEESLEATWKICKMNLAIRGIAGNIQLGNSFHDDKFKDLRADFVMANPPFNISKWRGNLLQDDVRWRYGLPPDNNANYAWIQHFIYHLSPTGRAGFVMANGSMSVGNVEGEIRRRIVDDDLVDCMVALPGQLFYTTSIPVCLWFLAKSKSGKGQRDHRGETLFIDARKLFRKVDRTHNELTGEHVARIADTYHAWRGEPGLPAYQDIPGFCRSATLDDIRAHGFVLTPGRYVGAEEIEDDDEPFEEKMARLVATLEEQFAESARLEEQIRENLKKLRYGG
jgi:type I restriction enzyme M protein